MSERSQVTDKIMALIRGRRGCWGYKTHGGAEQGAGLPDIICCYRGRFVAVECKRPAGGRTSKLQALELRKIGEAGGVALVARSVQELQVVLDGLDNELGGAPCVS